jgi:serine/threonine protein kinase
MDTLSAPIKAVHLQEPIPGYKLKERIGAGGYGEVWRAEAPGGLKKAIKIVHGALTEKRAERELRALNRIKEVQHPLLLSLERIEMTDDQLIIVTELAQGSLKDRFDEHVDAGLRGIPRDELLAYMRDVADALDYLFEHHALQHLDVKPENLLLIADRVKVADFGLVKDLDEQAETLVNGLTPLYAPPEVFDGRPNRNSDQYSLAIVYQDLLTGERPFGGRTIAQLAAQHLHASPCLSSLPKSDQPIVARALSKDPQRRFPNCRALIDSLFESPKAAMRSRRAPVRKTRLTPTADSTTETFGLDQAAELSFPASADVRPLPPLQLDGDVPRTHRPSIFIGIGGTGGLVLSHLRRKLSERFGNIDSVPSLQLLCLDTDVRSLQEGNPQPAATLRGSQILPISLRQPQEYRQDSDTILEWLNRRWLFNIPRSLRTEGIRALGRLALVDNFAAVTDALHHTLTSATRAESVEASSETTQQEFVQQDPRIFVIASTAGGTGSGVVLDLGYLLRAMLRELDFGDEQLHGVLLHSTSRRANERDLAIANTMSLLNELRHYSSPSGYPGEPSCNLPALVGDSVPFRQRYLVHLGDELNDEKYERAVEGVADYLYQSTAGSATSFFDACRDGPDSDEQTTVRTFGVGRIGSSSGDVVTAEADGLCRTLVARWAGRSASQADPKTEHKIDPEIESLVRRFANNMEMRLDRLATWTDGIISRQLIDDPQVYFRRFIHESAKQLSPSLESDNLAAIQEMRSKIDGVIFSGEDNRNSLEALLDAKITSVTEMKAETLRDWFFILVDAPKARVQGARDALQWFQELLVGLQKQTQRELTRLDGIVATAQLGDADDVLMQYAMTRLRQVSYQAVAKLLFGVEAAVMRCADQLQEISVRLRQVANEFSTVETPEVDPQLARALREQHAALAQELDRAMTDTPAHKQISLSGLLTSGPEVWTNLVSMMRTNARRIVGRVIGRLQVLAAVQGGESELQNGSEAAQCAKTAKPPLLKCGGAIRTLLVAPESAKDWPDSWRKPFEQATNTQSHVVLDSDNAVTFCCEAEDISLENAVVYLAGNRRDFFKAAARLHTRIDVEWPSLEQWVNDDRTT